MRMVTAPCKSPTTSAPFAILRAMIFSVGDVGFEAVGGDRQSP